MKRHIALLVSVVLLISVLSGCSENMTFFPSDNGDNSDIGNQDSANPPENAEAANAFFSLTDTDMFTDRDQKTDYNASTAVKIHLNGTTATASSNSVNISGSTVQITQEATYILSGTLNDGMVVVNAPDTAKVHLILSGVNITSSTSAPLYILEADKVVITLADGTENSLANGGTFTPIDDNNIDAALFSKQDLTINGSGNLTITSPAGHGIVSKDDLVVTGGHITVNAASHALDANDSVRFVNASLTATAGKDGIHCENKDDTSRGYVYISGGSMKLQAEGDGISAGSYLHITAGTFDILAGGGYENGGQHSSGGYGDFMGGGGPGSKPRASTSDDDSTSMKGIKASLSLQIAGGSFQINSADDALHSNTSMTIHAGTYDIASGDDGIHAEENLTINGGTIGITKSYEGLEALHIAITGGDINLVASDDGLNAAGGVDSSGTGGRDEMFGGGRPGSPGKPGSSNSKGSILVSGGTLYINASGDGLDANGTLEISGGHTTVIGPTQGDTATLDFDVSGTITGGTFIGTGAYNMAQTFTDSEQGVISLSVGSQSAGTQITLKDNSGNTLISYTPALNFQIVILSNPDMISGETYTITIGSQSKEFKAN